MNCCLVLTEGCLEPSIANVCHSYEEIIKFYLLRKKDRQANRSGRFQRSTLHSITAATGRSPTFDTFSFTVICVQIGWNITSKQRTANDTLSYSRLMCLVLKHFRKSLNPFEFLFASFINYTGELSPIPPHFPPRSPLTVTRLSCDSGN